MLEQLKNHPILLEANAIQTLCQPLAELGITTFSHLRVFDEKRLTILCNHPKSFVNYMKKKYYEADVDGYQYPLQDGAGIEQARGYNLSF